MKTQFAITKFIIDTRRGSPLLWQSAVIMALGVLVCWGLGYFDHRLLAGVNVWDKPGKFFLSLCVQTLTLAWALSQLRSPARGTYWSTILFLIASWFELLYITFQASQGQASHFNNSSVFTSIMYGLMGLGALTLTTTSAFIGWRIWQQRGTTLMSTATAAGLILGSILGTLVGIYLSSGTGHWIGGDLSDSTGVGFFHWSTTGGDLRVSHFIGLHAAQILPLAALTGRRNVVYLSTCFVILATLATMAMAIWGIPLLSNSA